MATTVTGIPTDAKFYSFKVEREGYGHENQGFDGVLYFRNKPVAKVSYDGWGGMFDVYYVDDAARDRVKETIKDMQWVDRDWDRQPFDMNVDCFIQFVEQGVFCMDVDDFTQFIDEVDEQLC